MIFIAGSIRAYHTLPAQGKSILTHLKRITPNVDIVTATEDETVMRFTESDGCKISGIMSFEKMLISTFNSFNCRFGGTLYVLDDNTRDCWILDLDKNICSRNAETLVRDIERYCAPFDKHPMVMAYHSVFNTAKHIKAIDVLSDSYIVDSIDDALINHTKICQKLTELGLAPFQIESMDILQWFTDLYPTYFSKEGDL